MNPVSGEAKADYEVAHRGGRHLDHSRDDVLRRTALELLAEFGFDRFTMDEVAARAHAGKTTIYRRWSGKAELIADALKHENCALEFPDTGSLRGDLSAVIKTVTSADDQFDARVTIGVVNAVARDPELRLVFRNQVLEPRMEAMLAIFKRAVDRGEIPEGHDLDLLASLVPALILKHLLTSGELPDAEFAKRIVDHVVLPLATAAPDRSITATDA